MDPATKKRKADENGSLSTAVPPAELTADDCRKIIDSFSIDQLREIVAGAACRDLGVLSAVRAIADPDQTQRKLFIRGLGWETTTESLRTLFSAYGELEEAVVIVDKNTGKSKGYGFITFRHVDGAHLALKEPSKKIDGRMTVTQLAAAGNSGPAAAPAADVSLRKIYVGNVPPDMPSARLLALFATYGEIEEGPLGFDKQTGKFRGYALFVYKTAEAARASLMEPNKNIDGHQLLCKLASEGKKSKPGAPNAGPPPPGGIQGPPMGGGGPDGLGAGHHSALPGSLSSQYGGPGGGIASYGGFSGSGIAGTGHGLNSSVPPAMGVGGQGPSSMGTAATGGYGGFGGPYGQSSQYASSGGYGGYGMGSAAPPYRMPPESGHYSGYQSQHHPPSESPTPTGPRIPDARMFPYY